MVKGYVEHTSCAATDDGASFVALNFGDSSKDIIMLLFSSATGEAVESEMIGIAGWSVRRGTSKVSGVARALAFRLHILPSKR